MAISDYVFVDGAAFKKDISAKNYTLRGISKGIKLKEDSDYLSHRLAKGSLPMHILVDACRFVGINYEDYLLEPEWDLSEVPTYQLQAEIEKRGVGR